MYIRANIHAKIVLLHIRGCIIKHEYPICEGVLYKCMIT